MALSNDAVEDASGVMVGDPTEVALVAAAREAGADKVDLERGYPRLAEIPFDSVRKCMTTVHRDPAGGFVSFTKGAVEVVLARSTHVAAAGGPAALRPDDRAHRERAHGRRGPAGAGRGPATVADGARHRRPGGRRARVDAARPRRPPGPAAPGSAGGRRDVPTRRHRAGHDHRRSSAHGAGHCPPPGHHRGGGWRPHGPRAGRAPVRGADPARVGRARVRSRGARAEAADRPGPAGPRRDRRHDRRRRQRRAGAQAGGHRRGDGHHGHRRAQGSQRD